MEVVSVKHIRPVIAFVVCLALVAGIAGVPPAPAYGGGDDYWLEFVVTDSDGEHSVTSTAIGICAEAPENWDCVVSVPAITNGSITLPPTIGGKSYEMYYLPDIFLPDDYKTKPMPGEIGSIAGTTGFTGSGMTFAFEKPFGRIAFAIILDGDHFMNAQRFTFFQPGYDTVDLTFGLIDIIGIDELVDPFSYEPLTIELDRVRQPGTVEVYAVPAGVSEAAITAAGILTGAAVVGEQTPFSLSGRPIEYVVDRSNYIRSDTDGVVSFDRYFGMADLHYFFTVGYATETVQVTIHEADFVGLQIEPNIKVGDWGSGVLDFSPNAVTNTGITPTANIYFTNEAFLLGPKSFGVPTTITGITCSSLEVIATTNSSIEKGYWEISLPEGSLDPEYFFDVELNDGNETWIVPLIVRRVLILATSFDHREGVPQYGNMEEYKTFYGTPIKPIPDTTDYGDFQTFVTVFAKEAENPDDGTAYLIDHTLLVVYHQDIAESRSRVLGARQIQVNTPAEDMMMSDRHEVLVFREGDPQYADVADANRITAFVLDSDGISSTATAFGGVTFGLGAGWSHLLPNHPDWGSGKDGMEYERPVN
ncbi:MAG: hypothetical protein CVU86_09045 [Firmicutes bacterium HGW-Firmicutes-11]|jgi:hypothetical protein|nr:MAG: hypothetical protein CVU86_09045 [Firmicutes bacterium HGW-Firmicutes-11]